MGLMKKIFKNSNGGTLKFIDRFKRKTYYFDINYECSKQIFKRMKKKDDFFLLLSSDESHIVFDSIKQAQKHLNYDDTFRIGSIITLECTYALADKELTFDLFENIMIPDLLESYLTDDNETYFEARGSYSEPIIQKEKSKESYSIFSTSRKSVKPRFDWNDSYLEGLRIHGNIDDAESHADDEEYKHKNSSR